MKGLNTDSVLKYASEIIKRFEGFRSKIYRCPGGYTTIGYGHRCKASEFSEITQSMAEFLLGFDMKSCLYSLNKYCDVALGVKQAAALVSFIFNLGPRAFYASTLRSKLNREDYEGAANEFGNWVFAGGLKLKGLVIRRACERQLFLSTLEKYAKT